MVSRLNKSKVHSGQPNKKKINISAEDKLPHNVTEDIKDLFEYFDEEKNGFINYSQIKSILHYISGGILKRKYLENRITESFQKNSNFALKEVENIATKIWEEFGKDQEKKEIELIYKSLGLNNDSEELETALKSKLSNK
jgi:Ca2+-binding EF-hand superfamily protein